MDNPHDKHTNFGLLKDPADERDLLWRAVVAPQPVSVPKSFKLGSLGPVLDQGQEPMCVAFSSATLKMHQEFKEHKKYYSFDPVWLYSECKKIDGIPHIDGTYLRTALKIINERGYLARAERYKLKKDASFKIERYVRLTSLQQIKEALYHVGPVLFGIMVDESIYKPNRLGVIPEPGGATFGGHAMCIVGYDDNKKCEKSRGAFYVKNSWGPKYGAKGYIWIPYSHFTYYADWDAWRAVDAKDLLVEAW